MEPRRRNDVSTLIRVSRLVKQPLILVAHRVRPESDDAGESVVDETAMAKEAGALAASAGFIAETTTAEASPAFEAAYDHAVAISEGVTGAGVAAAALTYAEYKERFQQELESLRETAVQEGRREGVAQGREQAEGEYQEKLENLASVIASAKQALDGDIDALDEIGAEVVYEAVLKILGDTLITRAGAQAAVREVIKRARDATRLTVRLSPADFEDVKGSRAALLENLAGSAVEIVPDERVELGGCLLETPGGNLDGRLEVQLQCLRDALLNARIRRPDGGASA